MVSVSTSNSCLSAAPPGRLQQQEHAAAEDPRGAAEADGPEQSGQRRHRQQCARQHTRGGWDATLGYPFRQQGLGHTAETGNPEAGTADATQLLLNESVPREVVPQKSC